LNLDFFKEFTDNYEAIDALNSQKEKIISWKDELFTHIQNLSEAKDKEVGSIAEPFYKKVDEIVNSIKVLGPFIETTQSKEM
jgi:hypothetical protein